MIPLRDRAVPGWKNIFPHHPLLPSSPVPFPLQLCSPQGSWAAPPIVGVGIGKGQWSRQLPSHWGRSSSWPAGQEGEGLGLRRDLSREQGKGGWWWVELRGWPPSASSALTVRTGLMASVAWSRSEHCGEGWHAGVPPAHQQLLYAWHLTLQCVGTTGDFGKGWGTSWGHPGWGLQSW